MFCPFCNQRMVHADAAIYGRGAFECEECGEISYNERKARAPKVKLDVSVPTHSPKRR